MENLPEILRALAEYGVTFPSLILLFLVYFFGAEQSIFPKFWKKINEGDTKKVTMFDLHKEMTTLRSYFNHETTEKLAQIRETQQAIAEDIKNINRKHTEYEKYGIHVRKEEN